jgi:hypothetical protein
VSGRWDDPNWWPARRKPQKPPPSASKLVLGTLLPIVAVAGLVIAATGFRHSGHTAQGTTAPVSATQGVTTAPADPQQAFEDCMRSAGVGHRSGFGRFGGPSRDEVQKLQAAVAVCRSILQGGNAPTAPPATTGPVTPPVA